MPTTQNTSWLGALVCAGCSLTALACESLAQEPCRIEIVDRETGWPVPLVELRTTHQVRLVSDNAGLIACDVPEVMGRETWFSVIGHGTPHSGSIAWNAFRNRWVTVFMQALGEPSAFGELWYAEADAPTGPWAPAVKVLTHENYTFYNPRLHPEFTPADSPVLLFEATYTALFADHADKTPRYDYNQILYRLDLDDPALAPARGE